MSLQISYPADHFLPLFCSAEVSPTSVAFLKGTQLHSTQERQQIQIQLFCVMKNETCKVVPFNFLNHSRRKDTIFVFLIFILLCLCFAQDVPLQRSGLIFQSIYKNPFKNSLMNQVSNGCGCDSTRVSAIAFMLEDWKLPENLD